MANRMLLCVPINNGDGTFRDETSTRLPQADNNDPWLMWIDLIDLDMDSQEDILASPVGAQEPLFYLSDADGAFRPLPNVSSIEGPSLVTFLDLDQDRFLDALWSYPGCDDGTCPEIHFIVRALGCPVFLPSVSRNHSVGDWLREVAQETARQPFTRAPQYATIATSALAGVGLPHSLGQTPEPEHSKRWNSTFHQQWNGLYPRYPLPLLCRLIR